MLRTQTCRLVPARAEMSLTSAVSTTPPPAAAQTATTAASTWCCGPRWGRRGDGRYGGQGYGRWALWRFRPPLPGTSRRLGHGGRRGRARRAPRRARQLPPLPLSQLSRQRGWFSRGSRFGQATTGPRSREREHSMQQVSELLDLLGVDRSTLCSETVEQRSQRSGAPTPLHLTVQDLIDRCR